MKVSEISLIILAIAYIIQSAMSVDVQKQLNNIKSDLQGLKERYDKILYFVTEKSDYKTENPPQNRD